MRFVIILAVVAVAVTWLSTTPAGVVLGRWFSGRPLDGKRRTNATFLHPATKVLHWSGHAYRWHWWRQARVAWLRCAGSATAMLTAYGLLVNPLVTEGILTALALAGCCYGVRAALRKNVASKHYRTYVRPLDSSLTYALDAAPVRLAIDPDRSKVEIHLHEDFSGDPLEKQIITRAVEAKVTSGLEPEWKLTGKKPHVIFTRGEPPPDRAEWPDVAAMVEAAGPDDIVFGLGKQREAVKASLASDSPHVGFNMGSGGGKTNLGSFCALQFLRRGDLALFIDAKLISYPWARCLPNVAYAGMIAEIHALLVWLGAELQNRNSIALAGLQPSGAIVADVGPRLMIFAEELNFVVPKLKRYWADQRIYDKDLPKRSPALDAIADIAFAGRQVKMHVFFIGQMLTAAATGSNDSSVRANIGIAAMARYKPNTWDKMTDEPMPPLSTIDGRTQIVTAAGVRATQVPYLHLDDKKHPEVAAAAAAWAREYAVGGKFTPCPPDMPGAVAVPGVPGQPQIEHGASDQPIVPRTSPILSQPPGTATARQLVTAGHFRSVDAARKTAQRHFAVVGEFGGANLYDLTEVADYLTGKVKVLR